jgi:hypothetical protein
MPNIKNNLRATNRPAPTDDLAQGYAIGSEWFNRNDAGVWRCIDAAAGAAKWIETNPDLHPWPSGHVRVPDWISATAPDTLAPNLLTLSPLTLHRRYGVSGIGVRLITAQPDAEVRLGIYRTNPADQAAVTLAYDAGPIALASGSGNKTIAVDWDLVPGNYWLAAVFKASAALPTVQRVSAATFGVVTRPSADNVAESSIRYRSAGHAYGPLPATPVTSPVAGGGDQPVIHLRRA